MRSRSLFLILFAVQQGSAEMKVQRHLCFFLSLQEEGEWKKVISASAVEGV